MSMSDKDRRIAYAIVSHLQSQVEGQVLTDEQAEGVTVALQCLCEAYGVEPGEGEKYAVGKSLEELFSGLSLISDEDRAKADSLKQQGNAQLKVNKFQEAISLYSQAIDIDSNNATFYCNRAAAYIKIEDYENALTDCKRAVDIDPQYARAHGRMGYIYSVQNKLDEARACFEKAIQLDPGNESYKGNLSAVQDQQKAAPSSQGGGATPSGGAAPGGPPGGLPGGMPGLGALSGLLQNQQFMNMATSMMQTEAFQNVASQIMQRPGGPNPQNIAQMMPEMAQAARQMQQQNPELFENLRQEMPMFTPPEERPPTDDTPPKDPPDSKEQ